jgi:hypothetical protein
LHKKLLIECIKIWDLRGGQMRCSHDPSVTTGKLSSREAKRRSNLSFERSQPMRLLRYARNDKPDAACLSPRNWMLANFRHCWTSQQWHAGKEFCSLGGALA